MKKIKFDNDILDELKNYCKSFDNEVCGAIIESQIIFNEGKDDEYVRPVQELVKLTNICEEKGADYLVSPVEIAEKLGSTDIFIDDSDEKVVCFFHSHPKWKAYPSKKDVGMFAFKKPYLIYSCAFDEIGVFMPNPDVECGFDVI